MAAALPIRRVAIVTQGLGSGGGISSAARWLFDGLRSVEGYAVDVHDLATSSRDIHSRRIADPKTWIQTSLRGAFDRHMDAQPWGANFVEVEPMRYRPRLEISRMLRDYDVVQVVAGGPALGAVVTSTKAPVVLQVATRLRWERGARRDNASTSSRIWRGAMTSWASRLELQALRKADAVLVMNDAMLAFASSAGQPNVLKIPPGIDTRRFRPPQDGWSRRGYILSVCRLGEPRKRLDRLVAAYRELVRMNATTPQLMLAGRGRLPQSVQRSIDEHGLGSRVLVRQDVPRDELVGLYQGASAYVQASQEEGLGLSVLEAMACGLPVVATNTAGASECLVEGVTGWLINQDSSATFSTRFADRLCDVLTQSGESMGLAGRGRCEQLFSSEVTLRRFTELYDRLLIERESS